MDDQKSGPERLQHIVQFLKLMEPKARQNYLEYCAAEIQYADGLSSKSFEDYLEAAKYV